MESVANCEKTKEKASKESKYQQFWKEYLINDTEFKSFFGDRSPGGNYLIKGFGVPGAGIGYNICNGRVIAQFEVKKNTKSNDKKPHPRTQQLIDKLRESQKNIESELIAKWEESEAMIKIRVPAGHYSSDESGWKSLHQEMTSSLKPMKNYFETFIAEFKK